MSNIIPPYINDRFNTLNAYIKNLYKAFMEFTTNFFVDASNNINISGTTISLVSSSANEFKINNSSGTNLMTIKVGTGVPNSSSLHIGSLYIDTQNGEMYIYKSDGWYIVNTASADL